MVSSSNYVQRSTHRNARIQSHLAQSSSNCCRSRSTWNNGSSCSKSINFVKNKKCFKNFKIGLVSIYVKKMTPCDAYLKICSYAVAVLNKGARQVVKASGLTLTFFSKFRRHHSNSITLAWIILLVITFLSYGMVGRWADFSRQTHTRLWCLQLECTLSRQPQLLFQEKWGRPLLIFKVVKYHILLPFLRIRESC